MKFRKAMALLLAGTMALSMAACGGGSSSSSSDSSSSDAESTDSTDSSDSSDVTLSVTIWDSNQEPGLTQILQDFTEKTGIKTNVSVVKWDEYWTLLESGAQGGSLPDVFWMHSNEAVRYMSNDILLDLTDKVADSDKLEMDKFPKDIKEMYQWDGKTYAVPKDIDTIAMWYNKDMFDEAGIDYPDGSWTWDEFYDIAEKLTKEDGSQYGFAANPSNARGSRPEDHKSTESSVVLFPICICFKNQRTDSDKDTEGIASYYIKYPHCTHSDSLCQGSWFPQGKQ